MVEPPQIVRRLPLNEHGRDFVIGDVHGAYDLVKQGMRAVSFDRAHDRLFVVGDLIDRGPGSDRVVEFLSQPYVHAVRGNHDHFFCDLTLEEVRTLANVNFIGMRWAAAHDDQRVLAVQRALRQLPVAIEVQTSRGLVGLVHADVPSGMSWQDFVSNLERGDEDSLQCAFESRDRIKSRDESGVRGIGRVFVGHTVQWEGPRRLGNVFAIDTGAVFHEIDKGRGALTIASLVFSTKALGEGIAGAVHALTVDGSGEFGTYVRERGG